MNCQQLLQVLLDYVSRELVVEQCETVEIHIRSCERCSILVTSYKHTVRIAKALPKCGQLPPTLEARLRQAMAAHLKDDAGTTQG